MLGNVLSNILLIVSPVLLATGAIRITNPMNVTIDIIIVMSYVRKISKLINNNYYYTLIPISFATDYSSYCTFKNSSITVIYY